MEPQSPGGEAPQRDALFSSLVQECRHAAPGARFSARLRADLERLSPCERRELVSRTRDGCAPLFTCVRRGNVEAVEYLIHVCDARLEQRGVYEVPDERAAHSVTPLWCAAVAGRLDVLRALADAGADLDAPSDSGSTPVRSACFMTHLAVVRFLVQRGADIHRPNHNGGTCLINSVQSARLCAFLLQRGADIHAADTQLKTALHYAIQEHRSDTVRLLLDRGADPLRRSRAGDDALRTACLKGATQIVDMLVARGSYSPERLADAHELLGATLLDEFNDTSAALAAWRAATAMRRLPRSPLPKRGWPLSAEGARALRGTQEWRGEEELAALDADALRTQALLVVARVLGPAHKDTLFRVMYRGAAYADHHRYARCVRLWTWALRERIASDTLLHADSAQAACALTQLLLETCGAPRGPPLEEALRVFEMMAAELPGARRLLDAQPVCRAQADALQRAMRCATHLLAVLEEGGAGCTTAQRERLSSATRALVLADVRAPLTGDTLLHLAVSRLNVVQSTYAGGEARDAVFPHVGVARALLAQGADACTRNAARCTALHVAAIPYNFSTELVEALVAGGAHLDQPNRFGDSAAQLVAVNRSSRVRPLRHVSLACLAARALLASRVPVPHHALPRTLHTFLDLHRP